MIIVLRGTNGSGKSHAVRRVLERATEMQRTPDGNGIRIRLADVKRPIVVVGPYTDYRSMGGCDCIRQPTKIYRLVEWAVDRSYHVLLEGVVLATRPWFEYLEQGEDVRYGFIDTPTIACLANIAARQARKGTTVKVSKDAMHKKWLRALDMYERAVRTKTPGMLAARLDSGTAAYKWTLEQLRKP